ncbi:MAG: lysophospholipid acyltransferase family protein [Chloroflexi bacterium]|nr:lysophospholipid acyltransferase family protein [Chloroflexota bacterium]
MLQYLAIKLASLTIAYLPAKVGYALACLAGDLAHLLSPRMRRQVQANLRRAMGPDASRLRQASRQVLRNLTKSYYELVRMPRFRRGYLERAITVHGWDNFQQAYSRGQGVVVVTAHLGNYFFASQVLALRSVPASVLVERVRPPALFRLVSGFRASRGLTLIPVGDSAAALREPLRLLKAGHVLGIACDRDVLGSGVPADFLGERTTIPMGAVALAARTGAAVLPCFAVREKGDCFSIYIEPPLAVSRNGGSPEGAREQIGQVVAIMEQYIRRYPEQWVVLQPVWPEKEEPVEGRVAWNSRAA